LFLPSPRMRAFTDGGRALQSITGPQSESKGQSAERSPGCDGRNVRSGCGPESTGVGGGRECAILSGLLLVGAALVRVQPHGLQVYSRVYAQVTIHDTNSSCIAFRCKSEFCYACGGSWPCNSCDNRTPNVQPIVEAYHKRRRERMHAFSLGLHATAGRESMVRLLPIELVKKIAAMV